MVQEMHVLKCFSCSTFQVHIVKKAKKWDCKICNQKQTIKDVFGRGSGKDCRIHVQKLNALKAEREGSTLTDEQFSAFLSASSSSCQSTNVVEHPATIQQSNVNINVCNKWSKYLEYSDEEDESPEEDNRYLLERSKCQKRKRDKSLCNEISRVGRKVSGKSNVVVHPTQASDTSTESHIRNDVNLSNKKNNKTNYHTKENTSASNWNQHFSKNESPLQSNLGTSLDRPYNVGNKSSRFTVHSHAKITNNKPISKWSKYLDDENDNNDFDGTEELYGSNVNREDEIPNVNYENKIDNMTSSTHLNETQNSITQHTRKSSDVGHNMHDEKRDLLQSLLGMKRDIDCGNPHKEDCELACNSESFENKLPKGGTEKRKFSIFEDPNSDLDTEIVDV